VRSFESLAAARYLSLTTFKRDGTPVTTPAAEAPVRAVVATARLERYDGDCAI
jgi:hypothetical protein